MGLEPFGMGKEGWARWLVGVVGGVKSRRKEWERAEQSLLS